MGKGRVEKGNMEEDWGDLGPGMGHLLYISTISSCSGGHETYKFFDIPRPPHQRKFVGFHLMSLRNAIRKKIGGLYFLGAFLCVSAKNTYHTVECFADVTYDQAARHGDWR